jgi:hypothetical protein
MRCVLDYVNLAFWSTMWMLFNIVTTIAMLVAGPCIKKQITRDLESVGIKVTFNRKDIGKYDKSKYTVELVVNDDRFFKKLFDTSRGAAESYAVRTNHSSRKLERKGTTICKYPSF